MSSRMCSLFTLGWIWLLASAGDTLEAGHVPVDTSRSVIKWKGTEMWGAGKHEGTVTLKNGDLIFREGRLTGGTFIVDMHSIAVTDIPKHEPVPRRNLINHLKSEDFFYTDKYPTATFEITRTKKLQSDSLQIWGDLSIRDVTKPISFAARQKPSQQSGTTYYATFTIDRFEWNISYQGSYLERISSILDNTLVDAEITLTVELVISPDTPGPRAHHDWYIMREISVHTWLTGAHAGVIHITTMTICGIGLNLCGSG